MLVLHQPAERLSQTRRNEIARVSQENRGLVASFWIPPGSLLQQNLLQPVNIMKLETPLHTIPSIIFAA
jgi:hypothetical protein